MHIFYFLLLSIQLTLWTSCLYASDNKIKIEQLLSKTKNLPGFNFKIGSEAPKTSSSQILSNFLSSLDYSYPFVQVGTFSKIRSLTTDLTTLASPPPMNMHILLNEFGPNCLNPSFLGDGFFCQLNNIQAAKFSNSTANQNTDNIIEAFKRKGIILAHRKTFQIPKADVTEITKIFCDSNALNGTNSKNPINQTICNDLVNMSSDTKIKNHQQCDGISEIQSDLGRIEVVVMQQATTKNKEGKIENNFVVLVQTEWGQKPNNGANHLGFLYGTAYLNIESISKPSSKPTFTPALDKAKQEKCEQQEFMTDDCAQLVFENEFNDITTALHESNCSHNNNDFTTYVALPPEQQEQSYISIEKNHRFLCTLSINESDYSWEILLNTYGQTRKIDPQFSFHDVTTHTKTDFWAWEKDPNDKEPHQFKAVTIDDDKARLKHEGIFQEVKTKSGKKVDLLHADRFQEIERKTCDIQKNQEARMINVYTHLDRLYRLTNSSFTSYDKAWNKQNTSVSTLVFPSKAIEVETDSDDPTKGSWDHMKITLGDNSCRTSGDATLISHEFSHLLVNDLRKQLYGPGLASINDDIHDLTDTISYAYTESATSFDWAGISKRTLDNDDAIPEARIMHDNTSHRNDQIFAALLQSFKSKQHSECSIHFKIKNWVRSVRLAALLLPTKKTCVSKVGPARIPVVKDCDLQTYRVTQRALLTYLMQMKGASDEHLMSELLNESTNRGVSLLPWQCIDGYTGTTSIHCPKILYAETALNPTFSLSETKSDSPYIEVQKTPRLRFLPDGNAALTPDTACMNQPILIEYSSNQEFTTVSSNIPATKDQCKLELTPVLNPAPKEEYFIRVNIGGIKTDHIPIFAKIMPLKISTKLPIPTKEEIP